MSVVMITGCSRPSGFGQRAGLAFAKAGHEVYLTMRRSERGETLEKQDRPQSGPSQSSPSAAADQSFRVRAYSSESHHRLFVNLW